MNLSRIDWAIIAIFVGALLWVSIKSSRHMKGVADFLSANRAAGRYLLTIAGQMGGMGVIAFVATFEMYYQNGLPPIWWGFMYIPISLVILLTGWVYWRFRETRALTLAQFFEIRYSRRFRIFAGLICWLSGIVNFGIFPAVAARFFIYFLGLPDEFVIPWVGLHCSTFAAIMALDLMVALMFVTQGGQISVMITECFQGIVCGFAFLIIAGTVMYLLDWSQIARVLAMAPSNASMVNPYRTGDARDFNFWYFMIGTFSGFFNYMAWQCSSGFNSAAKSPHEQQMGGILGLWRGVPMALMTLLLSLAGLAVMKLPEFSSQAKIVDSVLAGISDETIRGQMIVPVAMAHFLPIGIKGLLATVMIFISFTCHDTYMHSWGSIFVQDVYMPLCRKPLSPQQHIKLLRWSIVGVAAFSYIFSLLYPQNCKILMFFAITGAIWLGGAGAVIIGGLYWRWGTTPAAFASIIVGAVFGLAGLIVPPIYKHLYQHEFPVNNQWLYFMSMCLAIVVYVGVSLATRDKRRPFNLDKMLHRGAYSQTDSAESKHTVSSIWLKLLGITPHFTLGDRLWVIASLIWNFGWLAVFILGTLANMFWPLSDSLWLNFWRVYVLLYFVVGCPTTVWFSIGGLRDIRDLLRTLDSTVRNHADDGRVVHDTTTEKVHEKSLDRVVGEEASC